MNAEAIAGLLESGQRDAEEKRASAKRERTDRARRASSSVVGSGPGGGAMMGREHQNLRDEIRGAMED
jgi:hypothetical protein